LVLAMELALPLAKQLEQPLVPVFDQTKLKK
jgi:hypothetical protein